MDTSSEKINGLLRQPQWSDEDIEWIVNYVDTHNDNNEFRELLQERFIMRMQQEQPAHSSRSRELLNELHEKIAHTESNNVPVHRVHFLKTAWFRYAAAVLIIIGIGAYLWNIQQNENSSVTQKNPVPVQNDIAPGGNRATLTLADGSKIILDSAANGKIAQQENATITKNGDQLIYKTARSLSRSPLSYNTMSTPRGGQYQLTLPDGSQVWLNAESSITYPTAFTGKERNVSITGEAYFEVAKDKTKPFKVTISPAGGDVRKANGGGLEIEVLGTHFNVNTYNEEQTINTTLIEGSVKISVTDKNAVLTSLTLKPGQQGQLKDQQLSLVAHPDVEQVMAWKNGAFSFENIQLVAALREISRWYDVEVIYTDGIPEMTLGGGMGRDLNLSEVLKVLEGFGVRVRLEEKKLYISR